MFKKISLAISLFAFLLIAGMFSSCSDVLEVRDASVINPDIWDDETNTTLYINDLYSALPITTSITISTGAFGDHSSYCDETIGVNTFVNGEFTASSVGTFSATYYQNIRYINMALEKMESSSMDEDAHNRIVGQLYFMRGWSYWNLVAIYGGVPYVTDTYNPFSENIEKINVERNKTSECIQYIVEDLDNAIANLPGAVTEYPDGSSSYARITRAAAAALKGRVLLTYASPLFNPNNDVTRWETAYQANYNAQEIASADGYGLITGLGSDPLDGNFASIYLDEGLSNPEALFVKAYDLSVGKTHSWDNSVRPYVAGVGGAEGGGQSNNPTWNLVTAFPMANGMAITEEGSGYVESSYFKNRDPRFYATIGYNGCTWPLSGMEGDRVWSYGQSDTEVINPTKTGFYCRKMTNASINSDETDECGTDWIEIRFAEILLNLAECANETDRQSEAIALIGEIRDRAGIEPGDDNLYGLASSYAAKEDLTELIMNERFIEFAFENKRFWDMRRRNMFYEDLGNTPKFNGSLRQIMNTGVLLPPPLVPSLINTRDGIDMDTEYANYFSTNIADYTGDKNYPIAIPETYKFFAIPQNILDRSTALKQTQGWGDGVDEFDPYE